VSDAPDDSDGNTQSCRAKEPNSTDDDYEMSDGDSRSESSESDVDVDLSVHGRSSINPEGTPVIIVTTLMHGNYSAYSTPRNSNCGQARKLHYGTALLPSSVVSCRHIIIIRACINNTHIDTKCFCAEGPLFSVRDLPYPAIRTISV
jgi:hypothetical protein